MRITPPARLVATVLAMLSLSGCGDTTLTSLERSLLAALTIGAETPLPPTPTNAFADSDEAAVLGQLIFFDTRYSGALMIGESDGNGGLGLPGDVGRVACASCHDPSNGGSDHRSRAGATVGSMSLGAAWGHRNTPTIFTVPWQTWFFWDGRKDSAWSQAMGPLEADVEHNASRLHHIYTLFDHHRAAYDAVFTAPDDALDFLDPASSAYAAIPRYRGPAADPANPYQGLSEAVRHRVNRVFANMGKAVEAYERRLASRDSAFDRYMTESEEAGLEAGFTDAALRGAKLFVGRASCNECHSGPTLADGGFHNHGVPQVGAQAAGTDIGRAGARGLLEADIFNGAGAFSDDPEAGSARLATFEGTPRGDDGRCEDDRTCGAFKTPSLRDVAASAPYMHTGNFETLWDVLEFYQEAAGTDGAAGTRDPEARQPLLLSDTDIADIVAFLQSLTSAPRDPALIACPPAIPRQFCGCCTDAP